jgi:hypothetical protein
MKINAEGLALWREAVTRGDGRSPKTDNNVTRLSALLATPHLHPLPPQA